ncbi:MAG: hypothetical protein CME14_08050 [Gemmatimonadetes bacterium]|nr:hypothetical protein [Gemmatimonadota bacterium]
MSAAQRRKEWQKDQGHRVQLPSGRALDSTPGLQVLAAPIVLTLTLVALSFLPRIQSNLTLAISIWGAVIVLLAWIIVLYLRLRREHASRTFQTMLRPQHYVQALVQFAVFAYWGWHWRPVYEFGTLLAAQLIFAYVFDMLLAWSRRETYTLGFGPFPIIFSINLFLWFRDDWFYLQFLMVGIGFLGKEFVRWKREGRTVHIFNPSAFSLGLFSLVLIATGTTNLTWGQEIASTLTLAPMIYLYLFLLGLIVMYFFSITLVSGAAAMVLFGLSALYTSLTGVPYFLDSEIPAAVFLGLHLLVTDPSTSPRSRAGKLVFGGLYGLGVFGLYSLLGAYGAPTFYDKLLAVPLLNLSVRGIEALILVIRRNRAIKLLRLDWAPLVLNPVHMAVWIIFFGSMTAMGKTDGTHPGDSLPFWEQACAEDRPTACNRLIQLEASYCGDNSAWACNELGGHYRQGEIVSSDADLALGYFSRACELRFQPACVNLLDPGSFRRINPRALDLRLLLREGGQNLMEMTEPELYERACVQHDWDFACDKIMSAS